MALCFCAVVIYAILIVVGLLGCWSIYSRITHSTLLPPAQSATPNTSPERRTAKEREAWEMELEEKEIQLVQQQEQLRREWQDLEKERKKLQLEKVFIKFEWEALRAEQEQLERKEVQSEWDLERYPEME